MSYTNWLLVRFLILKVLKFISLDVQIENHLSYDAEFLWYSIYSGTLLVMPS